MKTLPLLTLLAALAAAVEAPSQVSVDARLGRNPRVAVNVGTPTRGHQLGHYVDHRVNHRVGRDACRPVLRAPAPRGYWQTIEEPFLVPGYWHTEHVPPTYGWLCDPCGHRYWGVVDPGGCRQVWVPARWETRTRQVWVSC